MSKTIACIVMSYNSSSFVEETLDSILNQSRLPDQLIITDDFSHDNSRSLIRSWFFLNSAFFDSACLYFPDIRLGTNVILSDALKLVSADYIKPMAADDLLSSRYFEVLEDFISINHPDAVFTDSQLIDQNSSILHHMDHSISWMYKHILAAGPGFLQYSILKLMYIPSFSAIFSTSTLLLIRNPNIFLLEDWPMWITLLHNNYSVFFLNEPLCSYRVHPAQITSSTKVDTQTAKWLSADKETIKSIITSYESKLPLTSSFILFIDTILAKSYSFLFSSSSPELNSLLVPLFLRISRVLRNPNLPASITLSNYH